MMSNDPNHLSAFDTHWENKSLSSVTSDTGSFHSAQGNLELSRLEGGLTPRPQSTPRSPAISSRPASLRISPLSSKLESSTMSRTDSGFCSAPQSTTSSRRTSTSSNPTSTSRTKTKRSRASTRRSSRSSPTIPRTHTRPTMSSRHTTPAPYQYQFTYFPSLPPPPSPPETALPPPPPPPPATCHYWTSDRTRQLEYAAIDAASRGFRGFFVRLVPDCILPSGARRTRFCSREAEEASDAGSVRRYRIPLKEEKGQSTEPVGDGMNVCASEGGSEGKRPGILRRWTSGLRQK